MTIEDTSIFNKKVVSFDFHGTIVERLYHHKPYRIGDSKLSHVNKPIIEILKRCLKLGIKTYIISAEDVVGSGEEGIANNEKILKGVGVDFPKENIYCTDFLAKDEWFKDLGIQFHVDDEIGNVLLARQMGIRGLLVDYNDHPVSRLFVRMKLNGKIINGEL